MGKCVFGGYSEWVGGLVGRCIVLLCWSGSVGIGVLTECCVVG